MNDKIRFGIIGTAWFADFFYLPILTNHPNATVTAICGRNEARGREMAAKYDIPNVYTDYRKLLDAGGLDAVIVYTPEDLHYAMTMDALETGCHVICEKPLAFSVAQARAMYEKAEAKQVKHMVSFTNRGVPYFRYLKRLLEQAYIGRPYHGHFEWMPGWGVDTSAYKWFLDPQRSHGTVAELGAHTFDLARWYLGEVARVHASLGSWLKRPGADGGEIMGNDAAFTVLEFVNGARATVLLSNVNRVAEGLKHAGEIVLLHGQEGTLELHGNLWGSASPGNILVGFRPGMERAEDLPISEEFFGTAGDRSMFGAFQSELVGPRLFIDAILHGTPITPSFYDGYKVQQIIEAAIESDKTGRTVDIDHSR